MLSSNGRHFLDLGQGTRIVIVGGWSPGPLGHLEQVLLAERCRDVVKPKNMNLWMPPFPGIWCCNPYVVLVSFVLGATIYLSITADVSAVLRLSIVVLALGWGRLLAALVVRTSIESSIRIISREGLAKDIDHNKVFFIGFSWGGAIVAEMIARGMIGGLNQPFALLIAPTTSLVAKVALQKDVPTRIKELVLSPSSPPPPPPNNNNTSKITVVHGEYDVAFCPNQERWNHIPGVDLQTLPDNHVFLRSSTLRALKDIMRHQLQMIHVA